jgi:hypothetical protein
MQTIITFDNIAEGWERSLYAFLPEKEPRKRSGDRELQAFNTATGERLSTVETAGTIASGAAIADGHVHFGSGVGYAGAKVDATFHALG